MSYLRMWLLTDGVWVVTYLTDPNFTSLQQSSVKAIYIFYLSGKIVFSEKKKKLTIIYATYVIPVTCFHHSRNPMCIQRLFEPWKIAFLPLCSLPACYPKISVMTWDYSCITIYESILVTSIYADFSELMNSTSHT